MLSCMFSGALRATRVGVPWSSTELRRGSDIIIDKTGAKPVPSECGDRQHVTEIRQPRLFMPIWTIV
jgi:hypothetical protein